MSEKTYINKLEEMIESREEAIENLTKVINDQLGVIEVLSKDDEDKKNKRFTKLINELKEQTNVLGKNIEKLMTKNENTTKLIEILRSNKEYDKICTLVMDELEIFKEEN
jgi:hypothetical protein